MIALGIAWWVLAIYVFVVAFVTVLVLGLCMSAGSADRALERARQAREDQR